MTAENNVGANTWSIALNNNANIGSGGGGGVSTVTAGNSNIVISGTSADPIISGTLTALTSNVNTANFSFSGNTAGTASFVVGGGSNFRVITTDLTPHIIVDGTGVQLGSIGSGYTVTAPTPLVGDISTQVATTAFVNRSQVNTLNFFKQQIPSLLKQSIIYNASTTITASTISAQLDGLSVYPQYISYGATLSPLIVAVGEGIINTIAVSTDGTTFQGLGLQFSTRGNSVAFSGTRYLAVGAGANNIMYSDNGLIWTGITGTSIFNTEGNAVFWNGTRFLLGGSSTPNTLAYSEDGTTVVGLGATIFSTNVKAFASNGEITVAVGFGATNNVAYSFDNGLTWTAGGLIAESGRGTSVVWTGTRFIAGFAIVFGTTTLAYSYNGLNWVNYGSGIPFSVECLGIAYNNQVAVAVGGNTNEMYLSTDLTSWSVLTTIFDTKGNGVIWTGSMFIAVGTGTVNSIGYSYDGQNWLGAGLIFDVNGNGVCCNIERPNRINFPVNRIVACGTSATGTLAYSDNGALNWNIISGVLNTQTNGVAVRTLTPDTGNYLYVATGSGTTPSVHSVALSNNGINWRLASTNPFSTTGQYVAYGNRWVAVGSGTNTIADSVDGSTWTGQGLTVFSTRGQGVAYNGTNRWVAVGSGTNTIAHSSTGTSFTGIGVSIFTAVGRGVVWGTNKFVACGSGGSSLAYSSDGITWNAVAGSLTLCPTLNEVAYNGTIFMAVGTTGGTGNIVTSPDGITWTSLGFFSFNNALGVAWAGDKWVITGSGSLGGQNNRLAYSTNSAGTSWVNLGQIPLITTGQGVVWNGSSGSAIIPSTSIVLDSTNSNKLDVITAPYGNVGYSNITITVKT